MSGRVHRSIGGGCDNFAGDGAGSNNDAPFATLGESRNNRASGSKGTVGGGVDNLAGTTSATIAGGNTNSATQEEIFAAGNRAQTLHDGAFGWGDSPPLSASFTAS